MSMDYSRLHTYTPPQCVPDNTGYTYSLSSSYSTAALDFEKEHRIPPVFDSPKMSRRSLRLHTSTGPYGNDSLADFTQKHSVGHSGGGVSRRETRTLRSRKQVSVSSSLVQSSSSARAALDGSLFSTTLEESAAGDGQMGSGVRGQLECALDQSLELKRSRVHHCSTPANGQLSVTHATVANGYVCQDCSISSERKGALTALSSSSSVVLSSSSSSAQSASAAASGASSSSWSFQDRSQSRKTGLLVSLSRVCVQPVRRALGSLVSVVSLLFHYIAWLCTGAGAHSAKGARASLPHTLWRAVSQVFQVWRFKQGALRGPPHTTDQQEGKATHHGAHSSYCGSVNVKDMVTGDRALNLNGSLCDDCKGKQHSETHLVLTRTSRAKRLVGALWGLLAYTGGCVLAAGRALAKAGWFVLRKPLAIVWLAVSAPGRAASGLFWWLGREWYQLVTLVSLWNVYILTRLLPKLLRLLLVLLPFLLLLGLWFWGPSSALYYLPAVNGTEWLSLFWSQSDSPALPLKQVPPAPVQQKDVAVGMAVDSERLVLLERRLAQLWERVEQGDRQQEERHANTLGLHGSLRQQLDERTDRESLGLWVSAQLEERLGTLRSELEKEAGLQASLRAESQEKALLQQQNQETRLAKLEMLLKVLATKTEEVHSKQRDTPPPPVSLATSGQEAHDALLSEVQRLEAELKFIRQDLEGVMGCRGKCGQLDTLHETVSAQVRRELQALFYGSGGEGEVPEPLLQWLSARYVSGADLRASLASLERAILLNVSSQLEQTQTQPACARAVSETVQHAAGAAGMSEEQVQLVVQNALRLYSQDRTGQVDYALESGGGSILSTRCSETYETKTALMSLFGLPLWYFSQSPRAAIQPDVYPGNCWAFKGSQGYLVIRLSLRVLPSAFCLEHIPKSLSPTGNISSAPRNFTVYGLDDEQQEQGKLLGHYTYQEDGDSLQTFPVKEKNDVAFQIIEVRILSNWGHPEYTCLYRFRVHGQPHAQ